MTYTPRRAPEAAFFEMLSTAFVWTAHQASTLLPAHEGQVDERIWIYHLHRSALAGRHRAVKQQAYIHQAGYSSDLQVRKREEEQSRVAAASSASSAAANNAAPSPANDDVRAPSLPQHLTPTFARYLENEEQRQQQKMEQKLAALRAAKEKQSNE